MDQAKPKRVPIQISGSGTCMWVICNDGTIWNNYTKDVNGKHQWFRQPDIPQDDNR